MSKFRINFARTPFKDAVLYSQHSKAIAKRILQVGTSTVCQI